MPKWVRATSLVASDLITWKERNEAGDMITITGRVEHEYYTEEISKVKHVFIIRVMYMDGPRKGVEVGDLIHRRGRTLFKYEIWRKLHSSKSENRRKLDLLNKHSRRRRAFNKQGART